MRKVDSSENTVGGNLYEFIRDQHADPVGLNRVCPRRGGILKRNVGGGAGVKLVSQS